MMKRKGNRALSVEKGKEEEEEKKIQFQKEASSHLGPLKNKSLTAVVIKVKKVRLKLKV